MNPSYELLVIGSGAAAQTAIGRVSKAGWRIAVIDPRPFGGTCALRGCDPKKVLVSGEEAVDASHRMNGHGIAGTANIDWPQLMAFKRSFTDPIPAKQEAHYAALGVDMFHGSARFLDPETLDLGGKTVRASHVLIATGAKPVPLKISGEDLVTTSDEFMELPTLPPRIVFIGGGYIASEFAHLAARAGAHVTILQRDPRLLPEFDADLVGWLMPSFADLGIRIETNAAVVGVERNAVEFVVRATRDSEEFTVAADLVVHAAGRAPDLDDLDLAAGNVDTADGRLQLNAFLQSTSNPRVYAAGDAAGVGPPLTPVASHDAKVAAANLLGGPSHKPDYRGAPSVVFTLPPLARVGMDEEEVRRAGRPFRVNSSLHPDWFTARRLNARIYGHKMLIDTKTDEVLGAHLVGPQAEEVINLFALAIRHGLTAAELSSTMFGYPTAASDVGDMLS